MDAACTVVSDSVLVSQKRFVFDAISRNVDVYADWGLSGKYNPV